MGKNEQPKLGPIEVEKGSARERNAEMDAEKEAERIFRLISRDYGPEKIYEIKKKFGEETGGKIENLFFRATGVNDLEESLPTKVEELKQIYEELKQLTSGEGNPLAEKTKNIQEMRDSMEKTYELIFSKLLHIAIKEGCSIEEATETEKDFKKCVREIKKMLPPNDNVPLELREEYDKLEEGIRTAEKNFSKGLQEYFKKTEPENPNEKKPGFVEELRIKVAMRERYDEIRKKIASSNLDPGKKQEFYSRLNQEEERNPSAKGKKDDVYDSWEELGKAYDVLENEIESTLTPGGGEKEQEKTAKLEQLKQELDLARKDYLEMDYKKNTGYKRVGKMLGRFWARSKGESLLENDMDIAWHRANYDNKLFDYKNALLKDVEAGGASNEKLGEALKFFETEARVNLADGHDQVKLEHHEGKMGETVKKLSMKLIQDYRKLSLTKKVLVGAGFGLCAVGAAMTGSAIAIGTVATAAAMRRAFMGALTGTSVALGMESLTKKRRSAKIEKEAADFTAQLEGLSDNEKMQLTMERINGLIYDEDQKIDSIKNTNLRNLGMGLAAGSFVALGGGGVLMEKAHVKEGLSWLGEHTGAKEFVSNMAGKIAGFFGHHVEVSPTANFEKQRLGGWDEPGDSVEKVPVQSGTDASQSNFEKQRLGGWDEPGDSVEKVPGINDGPYSEPVTPEAHAEALATPETHIAAISGIETVQKGDSVWKMMDNQLKGRYGAAYANLEPAQRANMISAFTNQVEKNPRAFGLKDASVLKVGQKIDFSKLFEDGAKMKNVLDHAQHLTPEQIENIKGNNKTILNWLHNHPGQSLNASRVSEILEQRTGAGKGAVLDGKWEEVKGSAGKWEEVGKAQSGKWEQVPNESAGKWEQVSSNTSSSHIKSTDFQDWIKNAGTLETSAAALGVIGALQLKNRPKKSEKVVLELVRGQDKGLRNLKETQAQIKELIVANPRISNLREMSLQLKGLDSEIESTADEAELNQLTYEKMKLQSSVGNLLEAQKKIDVLRKEEAKHLVEVFSGLRRTMVGEKTDPRKLRTMAADDYFEDKRNKDEPLMKVYQAMYKSFGNKIAPKPGDTMEDLTRRMTLAVIEDYKKAA